MHLHMQVSFSKHWGGQEILNVMMKSKSHKINYTTNWNHKYTSWSKAAYNISELCVCLNTLLHSGVHILLYKTGNSNGDIDNTFVKYNYLKSLYVYCMSVNCCAMGCPKQRKNASVFLESSILLHTRSLTILYTGVWEIISVWSQALSAQLVHFIPAECRPEEASSRN